MTLSIACRFSLMTALRARESASGRSAGFSTRRHGRLVHGPFLRTAVRDRSRSAKRAAIVLARHAVLEHRQRGAANLAPSRLLLNSIGMGRFWTADTQCPTVDWRTCRSRHQGSRPRNCRKCRKFSAERRAGSPIESAAGPSAGAVLSLCTVVRSQRVFVDDDGVLAQAVSPITRDECSSEIVVPAWICQLCAPCPHTFGQARAAGRMRASAICGAARRRAQAHRPR